MFRTLVFVSALLMLTSVGFAQFPTRYSKSVPTYNGRMYYDHSGEIVGRSYNVGRGTYWQQNGKMIGRSQTTRSGNTYFFPR